MRPSSLASCMRRMRFLAAITAGVLEGPPPQRRLPTRPSLGLRCLAYDSGSARQIQIWHGPGYVPRVSGGKVDVSLPAVGRSTLQSPRLPKALGSTS